MKMLPRPGIRLGIALLLYASTLSCSKGDQPGTESGLLAGDAAQQALKKIVGKMSGPPRLFSIEIQPTEMRVLARSSSASNHLDEFRYIRKMKGRARSAWQTCEIHSTKA
jgi:hypothetical protein